MLTRFAARAWRAWGVLAGVFVVLGTSSGPPPGAGPGRSWVGVPVVFVVPGPSCPRPPVAGHGSQAPPGRSVGRPGCGPPISDQVFRKDAFGAHWSKASGRLAYN